MLSMTEKALLGLAVSLSFIFAATLVLPVWTYTATLSTSPSSSNISAPLGRPFNVTCKGDSNLKGNFKNMKWLNPKGEAISNVKQVGKNRLLFIIADPKEADSGVYKCLATYENQNMEIHVSVNFHGPRPEFENSYEIVQSEEGHRVELSCQATGEEPLTYEWFDKNEDKVESLDVSSIHISKSGNGSILIIEKVLPEHEGYYMCTCSNKHGMSNKVYELRVSSSDGNDTALIRSVKTTKITATSVQFSILVSESVSAIDVEYTDNRGNTKRVTFKKGEVYEINGLIPAGLYTFKFRPVSSNGNGPWTTLDVTLLPSKPDVILRNLEGDTLKIEWIKKSSDIDRETIDKYQIRYYPIEQQEDETWKPHSCAITVEVPFCQKSKYTIAGLEKSSTTDFYEIEMRAHTVSGFGEAYTFKVFVP